MKHILYIRVKRMATLLALPFFLCAPLFASAEEISNFDATIAINDDASLTVTETITYDFGPIQKHGIFRNISRRHPQESTSWYKQRRIDVEIESVTRNGSPERFVVTEEGDQVSVKIGKAESTITGVHTYQITYVVTGGLSYLEDGTVEVYWNVTGNDWQVPIRRTETLVGPASILRGDSNCYRGQVYSTTGCGRGVFSDDGVSFVATQLGPYEGVTVAAEINPSAVPVVVKEKLRVLFVIVPLILGFFGWLVNFVYRFKTFYRPGNLTIVPQYEPYQDVLPMFSGVLMDRRLDGRDVTAGLLYLAQTGFIKIKKIERMVLGFIERDDYEVVLQRNLSITSDTKLPSEFHGVVLGLLFTVMNEGVSIKLSDIKKNKDRQFKNYHALRTLHTAIIGDLIIRGFYERKYGMIRKTRKGYEAIQHLKGFKKFLSVTGKERFKFHNAPDKSPEQFMEFLPFAVAFGVEEAWAEVFKDIDIQQPDWYEGTPGSFSVMNIGKELSSFSTAANAASGSGYRSSSSASGGGGFSGGGGGGGGGGSW